MSALEALAWTLPPSAALVVCCRLLLMGRAERSRLDACHEIQNVHAGMIGALQARQNEAHATLAEHTRQLSLLADRYR